MKTLIVIDMQNDFVTGALGSKEAVAILPNVKKKIEKYISAGHEVIFTRDTHDKGYLDTNEGKHLPVPHCFEGTPGWNVVPEIDIPECEHIYGDSITVQRCEEIYKILMENGFACSNVALGVGSFSFQCIEEDGVLKPFTRDTFSSCIKATYCEIDGKPFPIFKNPKDGGFKKSQKGCCVVYEEEIRLLDESYAGTEIHYKDESTWDEACNDPRNMLQTVFKDGVMTKTFTLAEVRANLHGGNF